MIQTHDDCRLLTVPRNRLPRFDGALWRAVLNLEARLQNLEIEIGTRGTSTPTEVLNVSEMERDLAVLRELWQALR